MQAGDIGIAICGVSSMLAVQEVCNGDLEVACEKIKLAVVCHAALVGVGTWVGTDGGGSVGEYVGEKFFEVKQQ